MEYRKALRSDDSAADSARFDSKIKLQSSRMPAVSMLQTPSAPFILVAWIASV